MRPYRDTNLTFCVKFPRNNTMVDKVAFYNVRKLFEEARARI